MKKVLNLFIVICFMFILSSCSYTLENELDVFTKEEVIEILEKYYTDEEVNIYINQKLSFFKNDYFTKDEVLEMLNDIIDSLSDDVLWEGQHEFKSAGSFYDVKLSLEEIESYSSLKFVFCNLKNNLEQSNGYHTGDNFIVELNNNQMKCLEKGFSTALFQMKYGGYILEYTNFYINYATTMNCLSVMLNNVNTIDFSSSNISVKTGYSSDVVLVEVIGIK